MQSGAIRGLDGDAMPAPPTDALLRAAKPRVLIGAAALLELLLDHLPARSGRLLAPAPKRAGPRRPISVSGAIAAESCQHFVTIFGDYSPMTRDENLNAMIQELRECSGLPAACMKAAKIEWPRPLALGRLAHVAIANAPSLTSARLMSRSEPPLAFLGRLTAEKGPEDAIRIACAGRDGITGFIVETEEEAVNAVKQLARLDRRKVRERFEKRFSAHRMARAYESHYRRLIEDGRL